MGKPRRTATGFRRWATFLQTRSAGSDGFHPTVLGSYLAALVIYGGLANALPTGLPSRLHLRNGRTVEVSAREASIAQAAAAEALR